MLDGRHSKLNQTLKVLKEAWFEYANDSDRITFEDKNGDKLIPQYQIYNQYQDNIGISTDLKEVQSILSDEISKNR